MNITHTGLVLYIRVLPNIAKHVTVDTSNGKDISACVEYCSEKSGRPPILRSVNVGTSTVYFYCKLL